MTLLRCVEQQRVKLLYDNALAISGSAVLLAAFVAIIAAPHAGTNIIAAWWALLLLVQVCLQWLSSMYRRALDREDAFRAWGRRFAIIAAGAGIVWGAAVFVLVEPEESLPLAFISACVASRATLSVITHAHFPYALYAFVMPIFASLALRYATLGGYGNAALAAMWIAVPVCQFLFADRHARAFIEQMRLRYEKERLIEQLQRQNLLAEQARARAEDASRARSQFFAGANHDLRQPLHSLVLFATALRNGPADTGGRQLIDQILQCTESLEQLLDDLLDIFRLDAGQVEVRREVVAIEAMFDRLRGTFAAPARQNGLKLSVRRCNAMLWTDPTLLLRALSNLIANAIHYTRRGGVVVACRRRGRIARIEVWDTGMGIPEGQHERTFEDFECADDSSRDRGRGLGLRLETVRRIVHLLEHRLRLRSVEGRGSCFTIEVPLADPTRMLSASTAERKVPNLIAGKLIVVIDDAPSARLAVQSLLESWECNCVVAADAQQALSILAGRVPDFVMADLRLRDASGIDAIRELRARLGDAIPAILVSEDSASEQLRVSAAGLMLMHKPLEAVRLRALLNHEFARHP